MIVGWQASRSLRADLAIDALEMAVHNRGRADDLAGLIHHSDRGVQTGIWRCATPSGWPTTTSSPQSAPRATARQQPGRVVQRALQVGTDLPERTLARPGRRRVRHPRVRRLVQPPTAARRDHRRPRLHHPGRLRGRPLPFPDRPNQPGRDTNPRVSMRPGAVHQCASMMRCAAMPVSSSAAWGSTSIRSSTSLSRSEGR